VLSRNIASLGIYPAVDPLDSTSRQLDPNVIGIEHYDTAIRAKDLDENAARHAKEEAERAIANRGDAMEVAEAQTKLVEAMAQLQALERLRKTLKH